MSDVPEGSGPPEDPGQQQPVSGLQRPVPVVVLAAAVVVALVAGLGVGSTLGGEDETAAAPPPVATDNDDTTTSTTSSTTTTTSTTTTEVPEPEVGSRENPIAVGTPFELGGARVTVTDIDLEANSWLVEYDERNAAPEDGWRYVIVHRTIENIGDDGFTPFLHPMASGVGSEFFPGSCLEVRYWPDALGNEPMIYPGGSAEGATCLLVPADEIDNGTFLVEFSALPDQVYVTP